MRPPELGYGQLFLRFLRFGLLAFGGPVAQIAMIRRELVDEERWISSDRFNKLLAVMQVLPGPEAHELCVHLGIRAKGRLGGLLAGLGFMLPGFILMLALAWAYMRLRIEGTILGALFLGVQAAILAVILRAMHRIGEHILVGPWLWATGLMAAGATLVGVSFWIVLPAAGLFHALASTGRYAAAALALAAAAGFVHLTFGAGMVPSDPMAGPRLTGPSATFLFWTGLKAGLLTFGGAYTAIPFVRDDTVGRGWMTDAQFLDGLALSGMLPAPLVIFATFAGWVSGGPMGALAITAGIFLPAFAFSLIFYEHLEAVAANRRLHLFLSGIAAAVIGLIAVTWLGLVQSTLEGLTAPMAGFLVFAAALLVLYLWRSRLAAPVVLGMAALAGAALFD